MQNQRSELSVREKEIKRQKSIRPPKSSENSFKLQTSPTTEKFALMLLRKCRNVPKHNYRNIPRQVQRHEWQIIDNQKCTLVPRQQCHSVPRKQCTIVPEENCRNVPDKNADLFPDNLARTLQDRFKEKTARVCLKILHYYSKTVMYQCP